MFVPHLFFFNSTHLLFFSSFFLSSSFFFFVCLNENGEKYRIFFLFIILTSFPIVCVCMYMYVRCLCLCYWKANKKKYLTTKINRYKFMLFLNYMIYWRNYLYSFFLFVLCSLSLSTSFFFLTKQIQRNLCHVFTNYLRDEKKKKEERNNQQITLCFNCCPKKGKDVIYNFTSYFSPNIQLAKNLFPLKYFSWYFRFSHWSILSHTNRIFKNKYTIMIYFHE